MRDQVDYTPADLFKHVACLWEADYVLKSKPEQEIRGGGDPGRQPDLPAVVADIRRSWSRSGLDATERQVFVCRAFWELSLEAIGALYDITEQQVADVLDVVTAQLIATLNGGTR